MDPDKPKDKNDYLETYYFDENSQLERRIALGDSTFMKKIKSKKKREIMIQIIKDVQQQILTHNTFAKIFKQLKKKCDANPELLRDQPGRQNPSSSEQENQRQELDGAQDKYPPGSEEYENNLRNQEEQGEVTLTKGEVNNHFFVRMKWTSKTIPVKTPRIWFRWLKIT